MHLLDVELQDVSGAGDPTHLAPVLPPLAARLSWGQASSKGREQGRMLVWVRATGQELLDAEALGAKVLDRVAGDSDSTRWENALRTRPPFYDDHVQLRQDYIDALRAGHPSARGKGEQLGASYNRLRAYHRSARREQVVAYRSRAAAEERPTSRASRGPGGAAGMIIMLAATVGLAAACAWALRHLGPEGPALAMAVLAVDDFDGHAAGTNLNGLTCSDGVNTWATGDNSGFQSESGGSGQAEGVPSTSVPYSSYISTLGDVADVAAETITPSLSGHERQHVGPMVRWSAGPDAYIVRPLGEPINEMILLTVVAGAYTVLGRQTGLTQVIGGIVRLECEGEDLTGSYDGTVFAGPITDTDHATGKVGIYGNAQPGNRNTDDLLAESLGGGGGGATPSEGERKGFHVPFVSPIHQNHRNFHLQ